MIERQKYKDAERQRDSNTYTQRRRQIEREKKVIKSGRQSDRQRERYKKIDRDTDRPRDIGADT